MPPKHQLTQKEAEKRNFKQKDRSRNVSKKPLINNIKTKKNRDRYHANKGTCVETNKPSAGQSAGATQQAAKTFSSTTPIIGVPTQLKTNLMVAFPWSSRKSFNKLSNRT